MVTQPSRHLLYTTILVFALCGMSLTILTGWAGQLSLGQMAFAGIGALLAAAFRRGINIDIGWRDTRLIHGGLEAAGLRRRPSSLAALLTAALAALIGVGALRVRGLLLAVSTFAFGARRQPVHVPPADPDRGLARLGAVPAHRLLRHRRP